MALPEFILPPHRELRLWPHFKGVQKEAKKRLGVLSKLMKWVVQPRASCCLEEWVAILTADSSAQQQSWQRRQMGRWMLRKALGRQKEK